MSPRDHGTRDFLALTGCAKVDGMKVLITLVALTISACASAGPAATAPDPSAVLIAIASPTASPRPSLWPPGGAVPLELEGKWFQGATDDHRATTMVLSGYTYGLLEVGASGNVVVNGNEIFFFSGTGCGAYLPDGIGRYTWSLTAASELRIVRIEDPCGRSSLNDVWSRTRP